jgi:hypothetical protein
MPHIPDPRGLVPYLLLILALVALLWYDLAVYMHYLETATPRYAYFRENYTLINMFYELFNL